MAGYPEQLIAEIRSRVDLVDVVSRYVRLERKGRRAQGLCPFHSEKSPSFHVVGDKGFFHCFGCQEGGDAYSFLMKIEGLGFVEAVQRLAHDAGVELPELRPASPQEEAARAKKKRLLEVIAAADEAFQRCLWQAPEGAPGREALEARGIQADTARRFGLGYAPLRADPLRSLGAMGYTEDELEAVGLLGRGDDRSAYPRFRGRLMIPIRDAGGKTIAFGGRVIEGEHPAKYINSPETALYHKSSVLFGLDQARDAFRREGGALMVEGYFDVIALAQAGVGGAVAACGTALTSGHVQTLTRYVSDLYLVFDGDAAGQRAAQKAHAVVAGAPGLLTRVVSLGGGDDPDTFARREGAEAFRALLSEAPPLTTALLDQLIAEAGRAPEERARALDAARELLTRLRDPAVRAGYTQQLAAGLGFSEEVVGARLFGGQGRGRSRGAAPAPRERLGPDGRPEPPPPWEGQPLSGPAPLDADPGGPAHSGAPAPAAPTGPQISEAEVAICALLLTHPNELADDYRTLFAEPRLLHPSVRALIEATLGMIQDGRKVDVGVTMTQIDDPALSSRLRATLIAQDGDASGHNLSRTLEGYAQKITRSADQRIMRALSAEFEGSDLDPIEQARRLQEAKLRRRGRPPKP